MLQIFQPHKTNTQWIKLETQEFPYLDLEAKTIRIHATNEWQYCWSCSNAWNEWKNCWNYTVALTQTHIHVFVYVMEGNEGSGKCFRRADINSPPTFACRTGYRPQYVNASFFRRFSLFAPRFSFTKYLLDLLWRTVFREYAEVLYITSNSISFAQYT